VECERQNKLGPPRARAVWFATATFDSSMNSADTDAALARRRVASTVGGMDLSLGTSNRSIDSNDRFINLRDRFIASRDLFLALSDPFLSWTRGGVE
jgi:hypothetical protein